MPEATQVWKPNPGPQSFVLACPVFELLLHGTRGGGKTTVMLADYAQDVGKGHGRAWQGVLFRRTYPELRDAMLKAWDIFPLLGGEFNKSEHTWTFPSGEQFHFRYISAPEDYWHYHGHEYPWQCFEELCTWPDLWLWNKMRACSRSSTPGVPIKRRATANPYGVGHNAVKAHFIDAAPPGQVVYDDHGNTRVHLFSHWRENLVLMSAQPDYANILAAEDDEMVRRAWLLGDWDIVAGGMFSDVWQRDIHIVKPFVIPSSWRIDRSFDWGSAKPFSVGWHAESDGTQAPNGKFYPRGTLFRIGEWYGWKQGKANQGLDMASIDIGRGIKTREKLAGIRDRVKPGPADASIFHSEKGRATIADDIRRGGARFYESDKSPGSRKAGWQKLRSRLLAAREGRPEEPHYYVFGEGRCQHGFLRTVPTLVRDERNPDDVDKKAEDHTGDEVRYRILAPRRSAKSIEHRV